MNNNLLLEINRYRELMSLDVVDEYFIINENAAGAAFKQALRAVGKESLENTIKEAIGREVTAAIKAAGKEIDPKTFLQSPAFNKIIKDIGIENVDSALREQVRMQTRIQALQQIKALNKNALKIVGKDAAKAGTKKVTQTAGKETVKTGTEKAGQEAAESAGVKAAQESAESTVTKNWIQKNLSSLGNSLKGLNKTKGWEAIKNHFKRYYKTYAIGGGVTALAVYFYYYGNEEVPQDAEEYTDDTGGGTGGGTGPNEEGVYTTPGDPYQYKVIECVWHAKGGPNNIQEWKSLAGNENASKILDGRYPEAKKGCSPTPTPTPAVEPETPEIGGEEEYFDTNDF